MFDFFKRKDPGRNLAVYIFRECDAIMTYIIRAKPGRAYGIIGGLKSFNNRLVKINLGGNSVSTTVKNSGPSSDFSNLAVTYLRMTIEACEAAGIENFEDNIKDMKKSVKRITRCG